MKKNNHNVHDHLERLKETAQRTQKMAIKKGASHAEIDAAILKGFNVNVRNRKLDTLEYFFDEAVNITVYCRQKTGSVTTNNLQKEALETAVKKAISIAHYTEEDDCVGLADKNLLAKNTSDLDLYHPNNMSTEKAIQTAIKCEKMAQEMDTRIVEAEGISIASQEAFHVYSNTHGFMGAVPTTRHSICCSLMAEQHGNKERDHSYSLVRDANDLKSIEALAKESVKSTVAHLGARKISTCKVPVLFSPEEARELISSFLAAISGRHLYKKTTFLIDSLGKNIFPQHVSIYENPFIKKALGSAAYDGEGVATSKKFFIEKGEVVNYILNSYSARKLKMQSTGNAGGLHNCFITGNTLSFDNLVKEMGRGFYVTELFGQGINLITGDYSRGAVGFWVEHGEIQYPVSEITIAGNLKDIFANFVAIGNDKDINGNIQTGSILVEEMTIAGTT